MASQSAATSLLYETSVARSALAAYLIISALRSEVTIRGQSNPR